MTAAELLALANEAAAEGPNMNEAVKGGQGNRLLPAGYAYARLVEVIELGNHPQEFNGKAKDPAPEVQLGFALFNTGDRQYANEDGTPYIIRPYSFSLSQNDKARAFLLFKSLNWKGTATSFGQLLTQPFLAKIVHEAKSKTDATIVSRLDLKGFLPPLDAASQMPYPIPEAPDNILKLLLWARPTKAAWDSLYVDGKWDDGQSKNRTQEKIMSALNFAGSPLQQVLMQAGVNALPTAPATAPVAPAAPAGAMPSTLPAAPVVPAVTPLAATLPTAPVTAVVAPVAPPVAPVGPVTPTVPTIAAMPTAPTTSPYSQIGPVAP